MQQHGEAVRKAFVAMRTRRGLPGGPAPATQQPTEADESDGQEGGDAGSVSSDTPSEHSDDSEANPFMLLTHV
jgi:hypothetical protein